jgi:hypothetical protein
MKKILTLMICMIFLVVTFSTVEAADFDNRKDFIKDHTTSEYGKIKVNNLFGLGKQLAEYELLENTDQCLINCYAQGIATLYESEKLFSDLKFKGRDGLNKNLKKSKILIEVEEKYEETIYEYDQTCPVEKSIDNSCENTLINSYNVTKTKKVWKEYHFEKLDAGNYNWRIEGTKNIYEDIDFIFSAFGKDMTEWAWWNNDWERKKEVFVQNNNETAQTNYSVYMNITWDSDMQTDFDDLRFLDSTETTELGFGIINKTDSNSAQIWVLVPSLSAGVANTSIYMYYNNPAVSTTGNLNDAFLFYDNASSDRTSEYSKSGTCTFAYDSGNDEYDMTGGSLNCIVYPTGINVTDAQIIADIKDSVVEYSSGIVLRAIDRNNTYKIQKVSSDQRLRYTLAAAENDLQILGSDLSSDAYYNFNLSILGSNITGITNGFKTNAVEITFSSGFGGIFQYSDGGSSFKNVQFRTYTQPEPTVYFGSEETVQSVVTNLIFPDNESSFAVDSIEFSVNSTPNQVNLTNVTLYIWNNTGGLYQTNFTSLSGNATVITNWTMSGISDGNYIWNALTKGTSSQEDWDVNRTFEIDTTAPIINLTSPTGTIDYHISGDNLTINWTVSDTNLGSCWFEYDGVNNSLTCGDNNYSFSTNAQKNLTFYANDTLGNLGSNFTSWDYKVLEINQTYNNETTEGSLESFLATIIIKDDLSITGTALVYNGTTYVGSNIVSEGITTLSVSDVLIPSVESDTNLSFFWSVVLSDSSQINLSIQNQTVFNIGIDNCSSFTNQIFNFTSVDEDLQTIIINSTIDIAMNFYSSDRSQVILNLSGEFTDNPTLICLSKNLTEGSNYSVDAVIKYEADNYAIEYYNIVDLSFTNNTEEQVITLYDLNSSDSTEFQLTFTGEDFLPVENALVLVERQYIHENTFKTVEIPKTDSNGQTILHLVRNDVVYNIVVMKDGEVLGSFSNLIAFCDDFSIGDCTISLNALGDESGVPNYDEELGIFFSSPPTYNDSTNIVSFDFISEDGTSKTVILEVERRDAFGNTSICSNTVISTSGVVFCNVGNITESSLVTTISVDGSIGIVSQTQTESEAYGSIGYVALFFLSLALMLIFGDSKNGLILSITIGFIAAVSLGWVIGGIIGLGSSGILLIVLTITAIWQINKGRST